MAHVRDASRGQTEQSVTHSERRRPPEAIAIDFVWFVFGAIGIVIALRFVLRLLGANPDAGFVRIIYGLSAPFMAPFEAVFPTQAVEGAVFDWSALLAILIYLLIAWGIASLIRVLVPRRTSGTVEHVEHVEQTTDTEAHEHTPQPHRP